MRIVTLTTDFGYQDSYVAEMKGVILGINSKARLVDLSHGIRAQNIKEAAYMIFLSYKYFPKGTIHIVVVDPGVGSKRRILLVKTKKFYFIAPDNGVLTHILNAEPDAVVRSVTNKKYFRQEISETFHGRDIMAPVAGYLSQENIVRSVGKIINNPKKFLTSHPVHTKNTLFGEVIYIDHFGNIVTNFTKALFSEYSIKSITIKKRTLSGIVPTYESTRKKQLLSTFGGSGFLEIAVNCGSAQKLIKAQIGDKVRIAVGKK
ncbi:S-adenosyl-l-methionine hydroxide adenosyltransferase family protein [Candidatus Omnitrophota bacterium]